MKRFGLLRNQRVAWLVLLVSLILTGLAWHLAERYVENTVHLRFEHRTREISESLDKRINESQTVLRATAGFVNASEWVSPDEWRRFVDVLGTGRAFPGMIGVAYAPLVSPKQLPQYVASMRRMGDSAYTVWPPGDRDIYAPIAYLDPENDATRSGIGFDAYSDPQRRSAMEHARDIGEPAVSAQVQLVIDREVHSDGFVFYMPIYDAVMPTGTIAERRAAIRGYTLSAFRAAKFIKGTGLGNLGDIELEIFSAPEPSRDNLLYDSVPDNGLSALAARQTGELSASLALATRPHAWRLFLKARPEFRSDSERLLPPMILGGGLLIDLLLFVTVWSLGRNRHALERLSDDLKDKLSESEQVLGSAVEAMGEAFVIYDADDRLIYCNELYREIYKTSAPIIEIGRTFEEIIRYGAERGQYVAAVGRVDEWVAERLARHRAADSELLQQLENGRWIRIRERRTQNGHIIGIRMDLTEVYRAKEAAEAASRAKSRFLATVSHEIRTPMNGILGMAQILLDPDTPEHKREEYVRTILRAGQTLLSLLNDILDLSKVEAGRLELFPVAFSPRDLVEETMRLFTASAYSKGLTLDMSSSVESRQRYMGDADRLRQMLSNLVGNAVKFTRSGTISIAVEAQDEGIDGLFLEFSVSDSGPGISAEEQVHLFEPFSQVDDSTTRQHGGSGLGFSIVRQLARKMGGEAGVESRPGSGSRFWFRIKTRLDTLPVESPGSTDQPPPGKSVAGPVQRLVGRVLVAEDNATHRLIIASALGRLGLVAVEVENGQQAVEAITAGQPFDLVLMDLLMPIMDGLEAMEQIRSWCKRTQAPLPKVLAITAQAYESDREQCLAAGMLGVVTKPIDFDDFARTLAEFLPEAEVVPDDQTPHEVDREKVLAILGQLMPLLAEHKFDAFACFGQLKSALIGTEYAEGLEKAGALLNRMEFDKVSEVMTRLAEALGGAKSE